MADRPIIFSGPMVRALIEGRKTQTRRILRDQAVPGAQFQGINRDGLALFSFGSLYGKQRLPYAPGDRLYVREAVRFALEWDECPPSQFDRADAIAYEADGRTEARAWGDPFKPGRLRPSIHMPRWASRLTLTVTDVRVQRLQDISEADALAEGIRPMPRRGDLFTSDCITSKDHAVPLWFNTPKEAFHDLWNNLHGPDAWDANPWVVALTFTVEQRNIDGAA